MLTMQQTTHSVSITNFEFIKSTFPELYRLANEMEYYYSTDHSCALLKARLFAEVWCHQTAQFFNLKLAESTDLSQKINQLKLLSKVPTYIIDELSLIRTSTNHGVHASQEWEGSWRSVVSSSRTQVKQTLKAIFELAHFSYFNLVNGQGEQTIWQEPVLEDTVTNVNLALNGCPQANLAIAEQAYSQLLSIKNQISTLSNKTNKKAYNTLNKKDLEYWLSRAHSLNASGTWQLYAQAYEQKFLVESKTINAEYCYKQAIKECTTGESYFLYANYLSVIGQPKRSWILCEESAKHGYHQAIVALQKKHYRSDDSIYNHWVKQGIEYKEINSFTIDAANKLELWLTDKENDLAKKRARTALITAQATQAPGYQYLKAFCDYFGYWGKTPKLNVVSELINDYKNLPSTVYYQTRLFSILKEHTEHRVTAIEIGCVAIKLEKNITIKAQIQFEIAMLMKEELASCGKVKCSFGLKALIKESAQLGYEKAKQFLKLPVGKALMRDNSFISQTTTFKQVNRQKQKIAKKQAKKANKK